MVQNIYGSKMNTLKKKCVVVQKRQNKTKDVDKFDKVNIIIA